jgi:hypothetical protein
MKKPYHLNKALQAQKGVKRNGKNAEEIKDNRTV